jgi:nucleotide-binding universal stress UspA family protein
MFTTENANSAHVAPALEEHPADPIVESIVLATAGGRAGDGAMRWVTHRGKMHRLNVLVLTVAETGGFGAELSERALAAERTAAERTADEIARKAPSAEVDWRVDIGDARERLAAASAQEDMAVVGSNRAGSLEGMLGATFSIKLAEAVECPAIVVPKDWKPGRGPVVVGIQGDTQDEAPLQFAVHEARVLHRSLRVIHAWNLPITAEAEPLAEDARGTHRSVMQTAVSRLQAANPDLEIEGVLAEEYPSSALTRGASGAELLVVGTHGRKAIDRFFVGSVSREILSRPPCPVAVVRPGRPA